jgi:hypothetical protein
MHVFSAVDLAGFLDVGICRESLLDEAAHLFFVIGVPFDSINDKAMGGTPRLFG